MRTILAVCCLCGVLANIGLSRLLEAPNLYATYLQKFGKSMKRMEDPRRTAKFLESYDIVSSHLADQNNKHTFQLELNHLSDLLPEEVEKMFANSEEVHQQATDTSRNLLNPSKSFNIPWTIPNIADVVASINIPWLLPGDGSENKNVDDYDDETVLELPSSIDWSSNNNPIGASVMSPVRNQGQCGACWAFVAVAVSEAAIRISLSGKMNIDDEMKLPPDEPQQASAASITPIHLVKDNFQDIYSTSFMDVHDENNKESLEDIDIVSSPPTIAWIPSLSVQQLVDCDSTFNKGCGGGSPYFAFRYIMEYGLVPWSRYAYQEKVQQCALQTTPYIPVAKYFIKDYGKLSILDSTVLKKALMDGPIALGVCGTDTFFLLYSSGVFDLETCCITQNHAITLVGYGHDQESGLDYWLAQNSWGSMWGQSGYIKIKRTNIKGESGICGMLLNPMYGTGGYILDEKGHFIDPTKTTHFPVFITNFLRWMQDNWRDVVLWTAAVLMCISLWILLYACYLDRLMYLRSQLYAANRGYVTIETQESGTYA